MREVVGADKQKSAVAMVKAAVALWDALGASAPAVVATMA